MTRNSHDFPDVYGHTRLRLNELGCVMLDVEPLAVRESLAPLPENALFWSEDPARWWIKGPVGEEGGHVTLLYGILKSLWRENGFPEAYFTDIDQVLDGWEQPDDVVLAEVQKWPDPAGGPSTTLVAEVEMSGALLEAHQRLSFLPHVDTFEVYRPHVTLAYVRSEYADHAAELLDFGIGGVAKTTRLNYGHPA